MLSPTRWDKARAATGKVTGGARPRIAAIAAAMAAATPRALTIAAGLVGAGLAVAFLFHALGRPLADAEAELAFEALRIQHGQALYVDPAVGAWELGPPPSRYYVLYTPAWPWLLARLSPHSLGGIRLVGRALDAVLWVGTLAAVVRAADARMRRNVLVGALLCAGFAMLAGEALREKADMLAVAIATLGLVRAVSRGELDAPSATLLAIAPLIKPNVIGIPLGAVLAHVTRFRSLGARRLLVPLLAGGACAGLAVALFESYSHGAWMVHLLRSTHQPPSLDRWRHEFGTRAIFLGVPQAAILAVALRRGAPRAATLPLAVSLVWATVAMAKAGSSTGYWLEPTMASLVALGVLDRRVGVIDVRGGTLGARDGRGGTLGAHEGRRAAGDGRRGALDVQGGMAGALGARRGALDVRRGITAWAIASLATLAMASSATTFAQSIADDRARLRRIANLRILCPLRRGEVALSNDVAIELALDGRIVVPTFQSTYLVRTGQFPADAWRADLDRPEVRCLVHSRDFLEPVPARLAEFTEVSAYRKELRDAVDRNFVFQTLVDDVVVLRRR